MSARLLLAALSLSLLSACATTEGGATAGAPAKQAALKDGDTVVCTREQLVGSKLPKKLCMTKHERQVIFERSQDQMRQGGGVDGGRNDGGAVGNPTGSTPATP